MESVVSNSGTRAASRISIGVVCGRLRHLFCVFTKRYRTNGSVFTAKTLFVQGSRAVFLKGCEGLLSVLELSNR